MPQQRVTLVPSAIIPEPGSRSFILGSTGSGKSTVGCAILEAYKMRHPSHPVIILDPKEAFVPDGKEWRTGDAVFPDGPHERIIGKVRARRVHGEWWRWPRIFLPIRRVSVYQHADTDALFWHLHKHADVRTPIILYADETLDILRNARASLDFRRLIQQGRARGITMVMINQRPKWIDKTMVSDVEYLHVGRLGYQEDAKHTRKELVPTAISRQLPEDIEQHHWWFVDRIHPRRSRAYTLQQEEVA